MKKPRRPTPWIKRTLLGLASFVLALALLEGGSHLVARFEQPKDPLQSRYVFAGMGQYDHLLFWTLRPGATDDDGHPWINSDGLRGEEIGPKQPDEYRILSLGESTTFARRMEYEECYSALLEARLPALWETERPLRVINAGVPAYSLFQGYQYLVHRGLELEPDMVLLYFGHNDSLPVSFLENRATRWRGEQGGMNDQELYRSRQSVAGRITDFLTRHSNAYRGLLHWTRSAPAPEVPEDIDAARTDTAADTDPADGEAAPEVTGDPRVPTPHRLQLLAALDELCRERNIPLVIIVPWYRDSDAHAPVLREFAASADVPIVDLPEILPDRLSRPRDTYFSDRVHPIPEGHELIAQAILEVLAHLAP